MPLSSHKEDGSLDSVNKAKDHPFIVFIVDDDALFLQASALRIRKALAEEVEVKVFFNGEDVIKHIPIQSPHIIFLDYHLNDRKTGSNGIETLQSLRKFPEDFNTYIISGNVSRDVIDQFAQLGAKGFIEKDENIFDRQIALIKKDIALLANI